MAKNAVLLVLVWFMTLSFAHAQNFNYKRDYETILKRTKDKADKLNYSGLLKRFNACDTSMTDYEVLALMIGFTGQTNFRPYTYLTTERAIFDLNDEGKFKEAIQICDTFIATHPLSQQALIEKAYAFHKLGQEDSAKAYSYRFQRIMKAMYWTRKVEEKKITIFSIGPADGQNFITKFLSARIGTMGSGSTADGVFCDILQAKMKDEKGENTIDFYFTIQHAINTMFDGVNIDELMNDEAPAKDKKKD